MGKDTVYFFAEMPIDLALWQGMADIIRECKPEMRLILILSERWTWQRLNFESVFKRFDNIHYVGSCNYVGSLTRHGFWSILHKGFLAARRFAKEIREIDFQPDAIVFLYTAHSLSCCIVMKELKKRSVKTAVLFAEWNSHANALRFNYQASLLRNVYLHFFGTAYQDIYELRTRDSIKTSHGLWTHHTTPSDYFFPLTHPFRQSELESDQAYFPYYFKRNSRSVTSETVVFCGQPYSWLRLISPEPFYRRLNELLDTMRTKHAHAKLIYQRHKGEKDEYKNLDLSGFEHITQLSSEELFKQDCSISTVYSFTSNSSITALYYGIRSYYLYHLFDQQAVRLEYRKLCDHMYDDLPSEIYINSVAEWLNGENDYEPKDVAERVRVSTVKILEATGIL